MVITTKAKVFISFISFSSVITLFFLVKIGFKIELKSLIFWAILSAVTESLGVELPNGEQVSVSLAITMVTIITGGPLLSAVVSGLGFLFRVTKEKGGNYSHLLNAALYKTIFNTSQGIICAGISGIAYILINGPVIKFSFISTLIIIPIYIVLNSTILAKMISLLSSQKFTSIWINNIKYFCFSLIAVGSIGVIIALAYLNYGYIAVLLFFGPLLLARYSFKLYIDMRYVYIETIQALNKSVEAKDPYTSGHANRVKEYSVKLAEAMKLSDNKIKNIETAAILHDIGKIGISENILNKPGKLTHT